jgi:hypothetical protein
LGGTGPVHGLSRLSGQLPDRSQFTGRRFVNWAVEARRLPLWGAWEAERPGGRCSPECSGMDHGRPGQLASGFADTKGRKYGLQFERAVGLPHELDAPLKAEAFRDIGVHVPCGDYDGQIRMQGA